MRLLGGRLLGALLAVQGGGLCLLGLVLLVEGQPLQAVLERLPGLWGLAGSSLSLVGIQVGVTRMRREGVLLALGTLGVSPARLFAWGAALGLVASLPTLLAGEPELGGGGPMWTGRGWLLDGAFYPEPSASPVTTEIPLPWGALATGAAAGALGVGLGLYRGVVETLMATGLLLVVNALTRGMMERGLFGGGGSALPSLILLLALVRVWDRKPLFPGR